MNHEAVAQIRAFNRFYTNVMGVLDQHILESPFSLSEARVLYELNHTPNCTARAIMEKLNIDEGYLSRILDGFARKQLIKKQRSSTDGRAYHITVTPKGKAAFKKINAKSADEVANLIKDLSHKDLHDLLAMMQGIERLLNKKV